MTKGTKTKAKVEKDESYLDYLGIGGDEVKEEKDKGGGEEDKVASLLKTIEGLNSRVDEMEATRARPMPMPAPVATVPVPVEPKFKDVTLDGLPNSQEDPEGFAKGLNSRIGEVVSENMRALSSYHAETQAQTAQTAGRSDQLWSDFQETYLTKLRKDLPEDVDASLYVEVAARDVAKRAVRRGANLDAYMYQTSELFMEDVYKAADKVLAPLRVTDEDDEDKGGGLADKPTAAEAEAHRTGGIIGPGGAKTPAKAEEKPGESSLISDLQEVQLKSGFY